MLSRANRRKVGGRQFGGGVPQSAERRRPSPFALRRGQRRSFFELPFNPLNPFNAGKITPKSHTESKIIPFPRDTIYDVVAQIDQYKNYLPWCVDSRILVRESPAKLKAELTIGFQLFKESYTSIVTLQKPYYILVQAEPNNPLFHFLNSKWEFNEVKGNPNATNTSFTLNYAFKQSLHAAVVDGVFLDVNKQMLNAFETRCLQLKAMKKPP